MLTEDSYRGDPRDPLSLNLYTFCYNNPIRYIDPTGHWGKDVHLTDTQTWVAELFKNPALAQIISEACYGVDKDSTGPMPWETPGYHFNRAASGAQDTRLGYSEQHYSNAVIMVLGAISKFNMQEQRLMMSGLSYNSVEYNNIMNSYISLYNKSIEGALAELGRGLHPLQDVYAHGNIGVGSPLADHMVFGSILFFNQLWQADNKNYDWKNSSQNSLINSSNQQRYNNTQSATIEYFTNFINDIGGLDNLQKLYILIPGYMR